jgi:hypothetical protein
MEDKTGGPGGRRIVTDGSGDFILQGGVSGSIVIYEGDNLLGSVDTLVFQGAGVNVIISGSFAWLDHAGGGGGGGVLGVFTTEDGVPLGTGTRIDYGNEIDASISGTVVRVDVDAPVTGSFVLRDETTLLGSVSELVFEGDGIVAGRTGTTGFANVADGDGGGGGSGSVVLLEDGQTLGSAERIDFVEGLDVAFSGSQAQVGVDNVDWHSYHRGGTGTPSAPDDGRWYLGKHYWSAVGSHATFPSDTVYAVPFFVPKTRQINGFGIVVGFGGATGTAGQAAIYEDGGNLYPGTIVGPTAEFITNANTTFTVTVPPFYVVGGKLYWITYVQNNGSVQIKRLRGDELGIAILGVTSGLGSTAPGAAWSAAHTVVGGGDLPDNFPTGSISEIAAQSNLPMVWVRYHDEDN